MRSIVILLLLTALASTLPTAAMAETWEHAREGWMVGVSLGGGSAEAKFDADGDVVASSDRSGGGAGGLRVGYAVRPDLVIGLEGNGWVRGDQETVPFLGEVDLTTTLSVAVVTLTWYPQAQGFFVRGGLGGGTLSQTFEASGISVEYDETGFGLLLALGYEWRLTRTFALGPQLDLAWMNIGEIDVQDDNGDIVTADVKFNYANIAVLANWYF